MQQQQSVYVRSCAFFFFGFFLVPGLSASDRRPLLPYSPTYTQQQMLAPRVLSSLPGVVLTHGITNGSFSPGCFLYVFQRHFFLSACSFDTYSCDMMYLHHTVNIRKNNLLAPPCVMCKHVRCCCTTIIIRCRATVELRSAI